MQRSFCENQLADVSDEACKQALPIAFKLYSLPNGNSVELAGGRSHWELIPRKPAIAVTVQASELETAADILEMATKLESLGLSTTAGFLSGPWNLHRLACSRKARNCCQQTLY